MNNNTFSLNYEIYNVDTNEIFDRKNIELEVTDRQLREMAKVMEDNGGYAPELSVFQKFYEYIIEKCIEEYDYNYAPNDEDFWEEYSIDFGEELPDELLQAVEEYVKYKEVSIIYYFEEEGEEKNGNALVQLPNSIYWTMVEAAKTKPSEKEDFEHLKDTCPKEFEEVEQLVASKADDAQTDFILKEFPYQVLEKAMESM